MPHGRLLAGQRTPPQLHAARCDARQCARCCHRPSRRAGRSSQGLHTRDHVSIPLDDESAAPTRSAVLSHSISEARVVGAAILSRNLMTSDEFTGTGTSGVSFFIPWSEVIIFVVVAYVFSLLLTWWPSRGATQVPVAEALRYE